VHDAMSRIGAGERMCRRRLAPPRLVRPRRADPADPLRTTEETRSLGLIVCRGPQVTVVVPAEEMVEIPNPFLAAEEGGDDGGAAQPEAGGQ
jgi:hypothetical protein